jgi:hypothetical protein
MARPRSPSLKTEEIIARLVPKIIALENPWKILKTINEMIFQEKIIRKVEIVYKRIPRVNIFFLPTISPSLPNGRRKMADASKKLLTTHPILIASACSSFPIAGSARLIEEERNGVRNAAKVDTSKTDLLTDFSS